MDAPDLQITAPLIFGELRVDIVTAGRTGLHLHDQGERRVVELEFLRAF